MGAGGVGLGSVAVPQPDPSVVAVVFEIRAGHDERDPGPVGMELGIGRSVYGGDVAWFHRSSLFAAGG